MPAGARVSQLARALPIRLFELGTTSTNTSIRHGLASVPPPFWKWMRARRALYEACARIKPCMASMEKIEHFSSVNMVESLGQAVVFGGCLPLSPHQQHVASLLG